MKKKYLLNNISDIKIDIKEPCIIFLHGDLGAGKTTFSKYILQKILQITDDITSPTYTYYNSYKNHIHFDLYRLENYDEFFAIGGEDILDNLSGVALIEWPKVISPYYKPDIEIFLRKTEDENMREIEVIPYNKKHV
ncbi:MAG: tRNA (adenosine(37)-N6)-threonylcarbamoyltransferase complex ATPase subunit type 1 TsaE [Candidatus Gracilibacteria bacterium]|nr:tRNA (adenosine(37)-N6)-threonylcarbamoyltransferase complex ATPase subunit type 1 TsaE [Candidatus Gracilibacteria bacterium]